MWGHGGSFGRLWVVSLADRSRRIAESPTLRAGWPCWLDGVSRSSSEGAYRWPSNLGCGAFHDTKQNDHSTRWTPSVGVPWGDEISTLTSR